MIIFANCTKVYGRYRTYYIHTPFCRAASRLGKRLGRQPTRAEITAELKRAKPNAKRRAATGGGR